MLLTFKLFIFAPNLALLGLREGLFHGVFVFIGVQ